MRAALEQVQPADGDRVLVRDLSRYYDNCHEGRIDSTSQLAAIDPDEGYDYYDSENLPAAPRELGTEEVQVTFLQRTASIRVQPAWDLSWEPGAVVYRECVPVPQEGDTVYRRAEDRHDWQIVLVVYGVDALPLGAKTFDRYWFTVVRSKRDPAVTRRMWCWWSYSAHGFVPADDEHRTSRLYPMLPR